MKKIQPRFTVKYHITSDNSINIEDYARDIAIEQTVEIPSGCIPEAHFNEGIIGNIEEIQLIDESRSIYEVTISYRSDIVGSSIPQLLNVLFGNISLHNNIKLVDLSLPQLMHDKFPGPGKGIDGIREILGVYERPLACTALKPLGLSSEQLAELVKAFAQGGIDIIKDDHSIGNQPFSPFKDRVARCQDVVDKINASRERKTLYFPMVSGRFDEIEDQVRFAVSKGIRGVLIAPMLVGPDTARYLSQQYNLIIMAHPGLAGVFFSNTKHGMTPAFLLGTLFRLFGADISIFPNVGGRFNVTGKECLEITDALRKNYGNWKRAFPCPAGGMSLERVEEMVRIYGNECVFLIGGSIMSKYTDLTKGSIDFIDKIKSVCTEKLTDPAYDTVSSCNIELSSTQANSDGILKYNNFQWAGLKTCQYKADAKHNFKDVVRHEISENFNSNTHFDVRYFEIQPGGYSTLEKHLHEHVIIGVRGSGIIIKNEGEFTIGINDIVYIAPFERHQLQNQGKEPFGFYCIVDRKRDKPVPI